ncbi:MAG: SDR family NAD(P)-dependent oxidoreductase [Burkholderiales bacterium]|nr:SDR family NAD(P)-dependent oxidoreductase [Burkholderiales bacterium]
MALVTSRRLARHRAARSRSSWRGTARAWSGPRRARPARAQLAEAGLVGKVLDVRDDARCDALVAEIQQELGDILVLVNNAAVTRDNLALRMKDAEWDEVIATDLRAVFRLSRAVLRGMIRARWGRIVNITSVVGAAGRWPGERTRRRKRASSA